MGYTASLRFSFVYFEYFTITYNVHGATTVIRPRLHTYYGNYRHTPETMQAHQRAICVRILLHLQTMLRATCSTKLQQHVQDTLMRVQATVMLTTAAARAIVMPITCDDALATRRRCKIHAPVAKALAIAGDDALATRRRYRIHMLYDNLPWLLIQCDGYNVLCIFV